MSFCYEIYKCTEGKCTTSEKVKISEYITSMNGVEVKSEIIFVESFKYIIRQTKLWIEQKQKIKLSNDMHSIQWIVSVPAIWSDESKDLMIKWFNLAGIGNDNIKDHVLLRYEPDCASISVLNELR